ncbi:MAG: transposase [Candidatus Omnitrophota bacterium]|nr:transposase [Candidatus Omnitrophota bacterium]
MARPLRIEYAGAFYHITSRGNEKGNIFKVDRDKEKFLFYLESAYKRFNIKVHAYCLMTNHYHLIVETPLANLSKCMQFLNSSYTTYYNIKRERTGHLFQGRYKAILVDKDSYMEELSRYTHLNPVRAKMVKSPEEYKWSSYIYYIEKRDKPEFLDTDFTLNFFSGSKKIYKEFVKAGITGKVRNVFEEIKAGFILGDTDFVDEIKKNYLPEPKKTEDLPELRKLGKMYISLETILKVLDENYQRDNKERKNLAVYYLRKYTDKTLREIVEAVYDKKMSSSAISKIVSRIDEKRKSDREFNGKLKKLERKMSMSRSDPN